MQDIKITYDTKAFIGAIGPSVWAKLGPERWFENYKIVVANSRGYNKDFVYNLEMSNDELKLLNTENIVNTAKLQDVALRCFPEYRFIVYKPIKNIGDINIERFVANDYSYSRYEDKKHFREIFTGTLPIPEHISIVMDEFLSESADAQYSSFTKKIGTKFVIQDNLNGGGRGTFVVSTIQDLIQCKEILKKEKKGTYVIISKFIKGIERSIQIFVSEKAVIRGPLQQQLVRNPELLDPSARGGMFFCGGRFLRTWDERTETQISKIVDTVSSELSAQGYKGICGIDLILDTNDNLWVLEINARTTGLLPLLNEQLSSYPLYLLHILEIAQIPYEFTSAPADIATPVNGPESFVVLFNLNQSMSYFDDIITTGNYQLKNGELIKLDNLARWNSKADCMVQLFATQEFPASPSLKLLKLANVFLRQSGFDDNGVLEANTRELVTILRRHLIMNI